MIGGDRVTGVQVGAPAQSLDQGLSTPVVPLSIVMSRLR